MTLAGIHRLKLKTERVQVIATTKPEHSWVLKLAINDGYLIGLFIHVNSYVGVSNRY